MSAGIPTRFSGTQFRSRLEARWAYLFERLGWEYEYEPFDASGYVPDFLIIGDVPLLVEVKPVATYVEAETIAAELPKLPYPIAVVGCIPFLAGQDDCAGCYREAGELTSPAEWSHCGHGTCDVVRWVPTWLGWTNHPYSCEHGHKPGLVVGRSGATAELFLERVWKEARNATQWKSPSDGVAA